MGKTKRRYSEVALLPNQAKQNEMKSSGRRLTFFVKSFRLWQENQDIMTHQLMQKSKVVTAQLRTDIPEFKVGTVVSVHYKIKEGNKERIQAFSGIVTVRHGGNSLDATFTVLKNATAGVKVTRTFPLHSPLIDKVELMSPLQRTKQATLHYLNNVKDPIKTARAKVVRANTK